MKQGNLFPKHLAASIGVVLGAGASRAVSYADAAPIESPLDGDFFDLLQRLEPRRGDRPAVERTLEAVRALPPDDWHSMERAFARLQALAAWRSRLMGGGAGAAARLASDLARSVHALLAKAHGRHVCAHHQRLLAGLRYADTVITFNYDLTAERALPRQVPFGGWLYDLAQNTQGFDLPRVLKLRGSLNWDLEPSGEIVWRTRTWEELDEVPAFAPFPLALPAASRLWTDAYRRLSEAEAVLVWGYSLPPADVAAEQLFRLALTGRPVKLAVVDPSETTRRRWRESFPEAQFFPYGSLEQFLKAPPRWWRGL